MPVIGGIADDLTGANTTGVLLARSKARTAVFFNEEAALSAKGVDDLDAIMISSNSRPLPANEAYDKVKDGTLALKQMGVKYYQKRIDTTCRGGIGVEIDAMLDQLDDTVAVVVPAMPQSKRILVGGYSVIDGVALINTPVAQDVRTPVKENYIPGLLDGQTRREVGLVTLDKVLAGVQTVKERLDAERQAGKEVIVVDAITLEDVDVIAKACIELNWNVLTVDPGPFTAKLAKNRGLIGEEEANIPEETADGQGKTVLIAAGSATPVTKKQMAILCEDPRHVRISVEPVPLIEGGETALDEAFKAVNKAVELMESENPPRAILFETALHGELLNLDEEDAKRHYPGGMSADRINAGLGTIVSQVLYQVGREKVAGLYTTGGDTMVNVCYQLGVQCLEVIDYVIPQTDVTRLIGNYDGLPAIGKGGLTGNDNTACDIVDRLFKEATRK
ncbi:MAG: four-carbon acid sugar kinase family protein [Hespellia sp.]|nr:four-carbon acid sugar kinase family protein [Hespellia sp.]